MTRTTIEPGHTEGIHPVRAVVSIDDVGACGNCGALVVLRLVERHRLSCEPRSYDLEPMSPTELGP